MTTTLLQLRNDAKARADMSGSSGVDAFIPDGDWNFYANSSLAELHDMVVRTNEAFYLTSSVFTLATGQSTQAVPADFLSTAGMDFSYDGTASPTSWVDCQRIQFKDRNRTHNTAFLGSWFSPFRGYMLRGNTLFFEPANGANGTYQLHYYPSAPVLVNDTDTFDDQRYWYEYVVVDMAIKALQKEESDVSVLMAQKQALKERILTMASDRDLNQPDTFGSPLGYGGDGGQNGNGWGTW